MDNAVPKGAARNTAKGAATTRLARMLKRHRREMADMLKRHARELAALEAEQLRPVAALLHAPKPDGTSARSTAPNACGNRGGQTPYLGKVTCPECRAVLVDAGLLRATNSR